MATSSNKCYNQPVIYKIRNLASFLLHIVEVHSPLTTVIVCTEQQVFLDQILSTISSASKERPFQESSNNDPARLLSRTIHFLSSSRTITLAFCNSVSSLHAYLSSISNSPDPATESDSSLVSLGIPILAVVNSVSLHRETALYSAQGLGTTFAAAVEAAWTADQRLVVVECPSADSVHLRADDDSGMDRNRSLDDDDDVDMTNVGDDVAGDAAAQDPWDEQIPILNARTKAIVTAGDRAWLGRTVSIRDVAKRWFVFEDLPK